MTDRPREDPGQGTRTILAALAVGSMLAGLAIYLLQGPMGLPADTARLIATAFVVAGLLDALLVYFWDRIFNRR
jgi:hypothetical protein